MHPQDAFALAIQKMRSSESVSMEHLNRPFERECWNCGQSDMRILPPEFSGKVVTICKNCGFIQMRDNEAVQENVVPPVDNTKLFSTIQLQASRNAKYLKHVEGQVDMSKVKTCLDIGCDQGMLSSIIKSKYPEIENYGIDPNPDAIRFGQEEYKDINLEVAALEDYAPKGKTFDLIILTGGIYRIKNPREAFAKMHSWLSEDGILVVPVNISLDDASCAYLLSLKSYQHALREGFVRCFFNQELFLEMVSVHFDIVHHELSSNVSYWYDRKSPFYYLRKKATPQTFDPSSCTSYYQKNLSRYLNFMTIQTGQGLRRALGKEAESIAIIGLSPEARKLADAALDAGIKVTSFVHPLAQHFKGHEYRGIKIDFIDYDELHANADALVIADFENAEDYLRLFDSNFPELKKFKVIEAYPANNGPLFYTFDDGQYLLTSFMFRTPYELEVNEIEKLKEFLTLDLKEVEVEALRAFRALALSDNLAIRSAKKLLRAFRR